MAGGSGMYWLAVGQMALGQKDFPSVIIIWDGQLADPFPYTKSYYLLCAYVHLHSYPIARQETGMYE